MKWYIMIVVAFFVLIICSLINTNPEPIDSYLQPFSSKARFQPLPDDIDLPDIPENIPEIHKQKCKINNVNSCSAYPNTTCEHFSRETKVHFSSDHSKSITIKNEDPNEGYCVNIHDLSKRCNIFHGYWALIKKSNEDNSYMKVCVCYRPGYIGNLKLFDACETPFICNGKVADINNKFESIECVCKKEEESIRIKSEEDNIEFPVCTPKKISSIVNWTSIAVPPEFRNNLIDAGSHYHQDIANNIEPLDKLIDPCSICPLTGQQTGAKAVQAFSGADATVFCTTSLRDWGIPFRRSADYRLLQGNFGPDGVLALKWDKIIVEDDGVGVSPQRFKYIISPCNENKKFYYTLNLENKQFTIDIGENNFLSVTVLPKSSFIPRIFGLSVGSQSFIKSGSIAHSTDTQNVVDQFYVNPTQGNLVSPVAGAKSSLNENTEYSWSTSPLYAKKYNHFEFLTYKDEFQSGTVRKVINVKGFCIRPVTDEHIHDSHWAKHKFDNASYFVDFLISSMEQT